MFAVVDGGPVRCALVVRADDGVDESLLDEVAGEAGVRFARVGSGGFGGGPVAEVYADESGRNLLIEAVDPDLGAKALLVWAETAELAVAVRDVIGDRFPVWSEQMLRAQLEETLADSPWPLVSMMMAAGGAPPDPETADLLRRAREHEDETVREAAAYAAEVARELLHPPMVMREAPEREIEKVLRPERPVEGEEGWVTMRAGVPERAVPRPVTWLRLSSASEDDAMFWAYQANWDIAVSYGRPGDDWREHVHLAPGAGTAVHTVGHPALEGVHLAVHGEAVEATVASLREEFDAVLLDGPPPGLERTAR